MESITSFYTRNRSAINLFMMIVGFFALMHFICTRIMAPAEIKANMTPPFAPETTKTTRTSSSKTHNQVKSESNNGLTEGYYVIRGSRNDEYCSNGSSGIICNRNFVKDWEKFYVKQLGNDIYAIRGQHGKSCDSSDLYSSVCTTSYGPEDGSANQYDDKWCRSTISGVKCDANDHRSPDTHFKIQNVYNKQSGANQYTIKSVMSDTYPNACADYGNGLTCNQQYPKPENPLVPIREPEYSAFAAGIFTFDKVSKNFEGGDEKRWGSIHSY